MSAERFGVYGGCLPASVVDAHATMTKMQEAFRQAARFGTWRRWVLGIRVCRRGRRWGRKGPRRS